MWHFKERENNIRGFIKYLVRLKKYGGRNYGNYFLHVPLVSAALPSRHYSAPQPSPPRWLSVRDCECLSRANILCCAC